MRAPAVTIFRASCGPFGTGRTEDSFSGVAFLPDLRAAASASARLYGG